VSLSRPVFSGDKHTDGMGRNDASYLVCDGSNVVVWGSSQGIDDGPVLGNWAKRVGVVPWQGNQLKQQLPKIKRSWLLQLPLVERVDERVPENRGDVGDNLLQISTATDILQLWGLEVG